MQHTAKTATQTLIEKLNKPSIFYKKFGGFYVLHNDKPRAGMPRYFLISCRVTRKLVPEGKEKVISTMGNGEHKWIAQDMACRRMLDIIKEEENMQYRLPAISARRKWNRDLRHVIKRRKQYDEAFKMNKSNKSKK